MQSKEEGLTAQGKNKNRVIDNLDDLDKEFCQTIDKLLALYRRIMIRVHEIEEKKDPREG